MAHARGVKVMIDSTFASPVNHRPLEFDADLVIHSATKYLSGPNDVLAGVIAGSAKLVQPLREAVGVLGGVRGLKTLALRVARHNENGLRVARWLETHPRVSRVFYPGLESHPDHAVAKRLMRGFGGVVTFELEADFDATTRVVDRCRVASIAPSLGGVETLIEMPALTSYWDLTPADRRELGITDSLVRLACGVEDADDLIADLDAALAE